VQVKSELKSVCVSYFTDGRGLKFGAYVDGHAGHGFRENEVSVRLPTSSESLERFDKMM